jgi:acetyl esterase/lipase
MDYSMRDDARIDPRIRAALGGLKSAKVPNVGSREEALAMVAGGFPDPLAAILDTVDLEALAPSSGLALRDEQIVSAPDGNRINLQIIAPEGEGPFPCVYYIHGGAMAMMSCYDPAYRAWGRLIGRQGVTVVMIDFRNALLPSSVREVAPYPAGLNDCVSGFRWICENAAALGIDPGHVVIAGDSGGANLSIATALTLKDEASLGRVAGLYLIAPFLAGIWEGEPGSSAYDNAEISADLRCNFSAMAYGIAAYEARDAKAWAGFATIDDLTGFPPVVISVNEFDQVRDDGIHLYRKLIAAGVPARCRQSMGTTHRVEALVFCCPDLSRDMARDIRAFAAGD